MPLKYNLTKYDTLNSEVHKLSARAIGAQPKSFDDEDNVLVFKAVLIASFSSGHSWQTHKYLISETQRLESPEVKEEFRRAITGKWKDITPFDIKEVAGMKISDTVFSEWLFFNVDKSQFNFCKRAWAELKKEFCTDCDATVLRVNTL
jgi:hypothetical protein